MGSICAELTFVTQLTLAILTYPRRRTRVRRLDVLFGGKIAQVKRDLGRCAATSWTDDRVMRSWDGHDELEGWIRDLSLCSARHEIEYQVKERRPSVPLGDDGGDRAETTGAVLRPQQGTDFMHQQLKLTSRLDPAAICLKRARAVRRSCSTFLGPTPLRQFGRGR